MALNVSNEGYIILKTKKDAKTALQKFHDLKAERDALYDETGLKDMDEELVSLKAAVTNFMRENKIDQIECKGFHGTLVKGFYGSHWVTDEDDLKPDDPSYVVPLRKLIEKKFKSKVTDKGSKARKVWMRITSRVANPAAIEQAVADGLFKVEDVSSAWVEKEKAPYVRLFED